MENKKLEAAKDKPGRCDGMDDGAVCQVSSVV
jgi:hypothetical protein